LRSGSWRCGRRRRSRRARCGGRRRPGRGLAEHAGKIARRRGTRWRWRWRWRRLRRQRAGSARRQRSTGKLRPRWSLRLEKPRKLATLWLLLSRRYRILRLKHAGECTRLLRFRSGRRPIGFPRGAAQGAFRQRGIEQARELSRSGGRWLGRGVGWRRLSHWGLRRRLEHTGELAGLGRGCFWIGRRGGF